MRGAAMVVSLGTFLAGCAVDAADSGVEAREVGDAPLDGGLPEETCAAGGEPVLESAQVDGGARTLNGTSYAGQTIQGPTAIGDRD